jgi:hypothetical protein
MTLYSVFDRRLDEAPAVVADRFSWFAALLPPVWAVAHGLWLALIGYVVGVAAIVAASLYAGGEAGFWLYVLFAVLIGFEAPNLRRRALRGRNYVHRAELIAAADDLAEVEWMKRRGPPA